MSMTSSLEARADDVCRTPRGVHIVISDETPARLPHERAEQSARRRYRLIARHSGEYLFVGLRGAGGRPAADEPGDVRLAPGDICFYDVCRPPLLDFPEPARTKVFLVARDLLGIDESHVRLLVGAPVPRTSPLGALLSPFLSDLAPTASASRPPVGEMLARNAVHLLATLAAERLGERAAAAGVRSPLVPRIHEFIELRLTDPELSPEAIARAHHISVRYLHKLFKDEGTTVGRWVQRRRLEECRRELGSRARGNPTIAAVAGRWGFLSAAHFSRVFRAAYGISPREWRDAVVRDPLAGRD